jgi:hypothetical protein
VGDELVMIKVDGDVCDDKGSKVGSFSSGGLWC